MKQCSINGNLTIKIKMEVALLKLKRILLILAFSLGINFLIWLIFGCSGIFLQYIIPAISFVAGTFIFKKIFKIS